MEKAKGGRGSVVEEATARKLVGSLGCSVFVSYPCTRGRSESNIRRLRPAAQ